MTNVGQSNCLECDDDGDDATYIFSRTFLANFRPNVCDCLPCHYGRTLCSLSAKEHSAGGVWRQQILNSILRKSKLGREEIQPVTISVSMAFRGLAPP